MSFVRSRRTGLVAIALGAALVLSPVAVWAQSIGTPSGAGLFNMSADASGMALTFGNPAEEPYPVAGGVVPQTFTTLTTGPSGYALSSVAWPGPLLANAGSLAGLLLPACAPVGGVCTPKPDSETTALVNYPVRAEAQSPGGLGEENVGPMSARAEGATSEAKVSVSDFDSTGLVSAARTSTRSRTYVEDDKAISIGESVLSGVEVAGGLVKMSSVRSLAKVVSDGVTTTIERKMTIEGLEIDGHTATIDEEGVHFEGEGGDPGSEVTGPLNEELLSHFGMEMFLTRPLEERRSGGEARVKTGSLVVLWKLGDSGQEVLVSLGGAGAHVQASPGFAELLEGGAVSDVPVAPAFGGPSGEIGGQASQGNVPAGDAQDFEPSLPQQQASGRPLGFEPASERFRGIAPGWVVTALFGGLMIGFGLRRVRAAAFVGAGGCVNERSK